MSLCDESSKLSLRKDTTCLLFVEVLMIFSIFAFQINNVNYDIPYYDVLFASNFFGAVAVMVVASFLLAYSLFRKDLRKSAFTPLFFLIVYLLVTFNGAHIANFPNYIYIDIYVHLPHVLKMVNLGHLTPEIEYSDVYVFPFSYIYYAIFISLTNASFFESGALMTITYTFAFALTVVLIINNFSKHIIIRSKNTNDFRVLLSFWLLLLPFIRFGYGPRFDFPFRFHFGFLLMLQYLALFLALLKSANMFTSNILTLLLLSIALVFTHPFTSILMTIALSVFSFLALFLVRKRVSKMFRLVQKTIIALAILMLTLIFQFVYVSLGSLLVQGYRYVFKWEFIPKLVEASLPLYISSFSLTLAMEIFVYIIRMLWRMTILLVIFYAFTLVALALKKRKIPLIGIAFIIAASIIGIPLIESILYWDRALTFIGLSLIILLTESYILVNNEYQRAKIFIKNFLMILVVLSVIISPLIIFEAHSLPTEWHGKEEIIFLETLEKKVILNTFLVGTRTGMQYTYYSVLNNKAPSSFAVFDSISATFRVNIYECSYPYALSKRDKEFSYVDIKELILKRSLLWSSNISFIFK